MSQLINDVDSHEMIPTHKMASFFGEPGERLAAILEERQQLVQDFSDNSGVHPGVEDDMEITPESVWNVKGVAAPGAIEMSRRTDVLDAMGVRRQLIFPNFGLAGLVLLESSDVFIEAFFGKEIEDRRELGRAMVKAHNEWAVSGLDVDRERARVVAIVGTDSAEEMANEARSLVRAGVQALWVSAGNPPGGVSPASEQIDDFWSEAEDNDVPVVLHIGTELGLLDPRWAAGGGFVAKPSSLEIPVLDVYAMSTFHYAVENYVAVMVLGGVFERHPRLRFGVIECSAGWVGPLARRLDMLAALMGTPSLTRRPSEYMAENVRVSPFWFEPVEEYFRTFPEVASVYSYASDYPHIEGGKESARNFRQRLQPLGDEVIEQFFISNAELLLPSRV